MKICVLSQSLYTLGGIQRVLATLFNKMIDNEEIEMTVMMPLLPNESNIFGLSDKVNIINTIDYENKNISTIFFRTLRKINQKTMIFSKLGCDNLLKKFVLLPGLEQKYLNIIGDKYDVVIGVGSWYSLLLSYIAPKINAITVGWMHSTYESYFNNNKALSCGFSEVFKYSSQNLDEFLVLTNSDKEVFDKKLNQNSKVLYNPVDDTFFSGGRKFNGKHKLLFVGRLTIQHKGLDYLISIIKEVSKVYPDVELTIVGDGPDRTTLEKIVHDNGLEKNVCFQGQSSNVKKYYDDANIVLVPSRWEGFGVVLIEAMACGTPVIAFENKGPNEIISNNIDGILIKQYDVEEFSNKIITLLDDSERWERMSEQAYKKACNFSAKRTVDRFIDYITHNKEE